MIKNATGIKFKNVKIHSNGGPLPLFGVSDSTFEGMDLKGNSKGGSKPMQINCKNVTIK